MRITQASAFLSSLLDDVMAAKVFPAGMQRPYVWSQQDVIDLCDSIVSGFPIGGFLSWNPLDKAELSEVAFGRLGPIQRDPATADRYVQLLLDGQNRLASLAWAALQGEASPDLQLSEAESATWMSGQLLVLDLERQAMIFVPAEEAEVGMRVPAWVSLRLGDNGNHRANTYQRKRWNEWELAGVPEEQILAMMNLIDRFERAFRDARITLTLIEGATVEEARSAFLRICRTGVQMSQEDFDRAVNWKAA